MTEDMACFGHHTPEAIACQMCNDENTCKIDTAANFKRCHEMQGVDKCSDCEVYESCCEYGDEQRDELGLNIIQEPQK